MVAGVRLGMLGFSPGNGHPFSFSAILNGYDPDAMRAAGWPVIADYLDRQDRGDIGLPGATVVAAWTPDSDLTAALCKASRIDRAAPSPDAMVEMVDAAIIARDDWESHLALALPFLEAGKPVFVDKPLTLSPAELTRFRPYLDRALVMTCSGMRFCRELDAIRARPDMIGRLRLVSGTVLNDFPRYGVHLLEAAIPVLGEVPRPVSAFARDGAAHVLLETASGVAVSIHTLGPTPGFFRLALFGDDGAVEVTLADNFTAFRRMLSRFVTQVRTGEPAIAPAETVAIIETVIAVEDMLGRQPAGGGG